jgi:hypothetical protein
LNCWTWTACMHILILPASGISCNLMTAHLSRRRASHSHAKSRFWVGLYDSLLKTTGRKRCRRKLWARVLIPFGYLHLVKGKHQRSVKFYYQTSRAPMVMIHGFISQKYGEF